jgi:hypothetical protein
MGKIFEQYTSQKGNDENENAELLYNLVKQDPRANRRHEWLKAGLEYDEYVIVLENGVNMQVRYHNREDKDRNGKIHLCIKRLAWNYPDTADYVEFNDKLKRNREIFMEYLEKLF